MIFDCSVMPTSGQNLFFEFIKSVGGFAGLIALGWKFFELAKSYLNIKVKVTNNNETISAITEVENNSLVAKEIINALLIVSPEDESILDVGKKIKKQLRGTYVIDSTNSFINFKPDKPTYFEKKYAIMPLSFYFSENIRIRDEKLTYRSSINKSKFLKGNYSVRFYIFHKKRYHRSTHDLFSIS